MNKVPFDPKEEGGYELVRSIVLERLRNDPSWNQYNPSSSDTGFDKYVEYIGDEASGRLKLQSFAQDVFWEFIIQGIIAPGSKPALGMSPAHPNLPGFHVTEYGSKVISTGELLPHDPTGYLDRFRSETGSPDSTVEAYLTESLNCFTKGNLIASVVMLGVASERAFLLLCSSLHAALSNASEKADFAKKVKANSIKPKQDWVLNKIKAIQNKDSKALPDNVNIMLTVIFDFIRSQRNQLGHPRETPPKVSREEVYVNLRMFPTYYKMLNTVIEFLSKNKV